MKKHLKNKFSFIIFFTVLFMAMIPLSAQNCYSVSTSSNSLTFSSSGGNDTIEISFPLGCSNPTIELVAVPSWLSTSVSGTTINISCSSSTVNRSGSVVIMVNGNMVSGFGVSQLVTTEPEPEPIPACQISGLPSSINIDSLGETLNYTLAFSNCSPSYLTFTSHRDTPLPSWISILQPNTTTISIQCAINNTGVSRNFGLRILVEEIVIFGANITQNKCKDWYSDTDRDGYGDLSEPITSCSQPSGYVSNSDDYNDTNENITNITPQTFYRDIDGDGFGNPSVSVFYSEAPNGYVTDNSDLCPESFGIAAYSGCPEAVLMTNENYIHTVQYQNPYIESQLASTPEEDKIEAIIYFDGLGRAKQQIALRAGGNLEDIITHIEYDAFGRQAKNYLPFAAATNGGIYKTDALSSANSFYATSKYENTLNPYSEKHFEASPLNRVLEQAAPGADWALDKDTDTDHTIKLEYGTNATDEVRLYEVNLDASYNPTLSEISYYNSGELYKTITKDENWTASDGTNHTTEEFKDKQGRVVLKRTYANVGTPSAVEAHDTYYVYDDFGNLTYVIPPLVNTSDGVSSTELDELCYQYQYDERNRLVEKKIPGKDLEYIVYDKLDRPVLTQDRNLRDDDNKWLFTKYDVFGRVAYSGVYTHSGILNQEEMQNYFDTAPTNSQPERLPYEKRMDVEFGSTYVSHHYSTFMFPFVNIEILSINYYDDYNFNTAGLSVPTTVLDMDVSTRTKGLATGSKIKVLDPSTSLGSGKWITTVTAYDNKARSIWIGAYNEYLETTDIVKSKLDFVGKVDKTVSIHTKGSNEQIVTTDQFTYDHTGRLLSQVQRDGNTEEELIVLNTYDELGQLQSKKVGGTVAAQLENSAGLQTIDYNYNIRGWLKNINEDAHADNDLFDFTLAYNTPTSGTALYNGNISQTSWRTLNTDTSLKTYDYTYDALNRITAASGANLSNYSLNSVNYDKNGNILGLSRQGHTDTNATTFGLMDNLAYVYDSGNKLQKVTDNGNHTYGFKDGANLTTEYMYDANGNMTQDKNKGITAIAYNHLNLPMQVSLGSNNISYIYDATGIKLAKVVNENGHSTTTEYAGNYVYKDTELQFFNTPEGYAQPVIASDSEAIPAYEYVYQYKDHLGNVRLSYMGERTMALEDNFDNTEIWYPESASTIQQNGALEVSIAPKWGGAKKRLSTSFESGDLLEIHTTIHKGSTELVGLAVNHFTDNAYVGGDHIAFLENGNSTFEYTVPDGVNGLGIKFYKGAAADDGILSTYAIEELTVVKKSFEIVEESNYYPFGLKHKGYNNIVSPNGNSTAQKFKTYQGQEISEELGYNMLEFKYRHYDPAIARFVAIDPLASKYEYNSTYAFQENKLGLGVELEGLELVYRKGTDPKFKTKFAKTVKFMNSKGTSGKMAKLNKSGRTEIVDNTGNGSFFRPSDGAIYFDPTTGLETTEGHSLSPATVLAHEVDHKLQSLENPEQMAKDLNTPDENYSNAEEKRVITGTEQVAAKKHGEIQNGDVTRTTHDEGTEMTTDDPTSMTNATPKVIELEPVIIGN